jgi:hypothetical protein
MVFIAMRQNTKKLWVFISIHPDIGNLGKLMPIAIVDFSIEELMDIYFRGGMLLLYHGAPPSGFACAAIRKINFKNK